MMRRPVAVPVMAKLVIKDTSSASRLWLARRMVTRLAAELPGRKISVTADSAYAGEELKKLPDAVTWTTTAPRPTPRSTACRPERTGRKGRPRVKGDRLPSLAKTRRRGSVLAGHGHPLRQDGDRRRGRFHLPVVLGHRREARHRHPHPGQIENRVRPGPGHHGEEPGHCARNRKVRREMGH